MVRVRIFPELSLTDEATVTSSPRPLSLERRERYVVFDTIANGGMASVHLGVALGALGFSRLVAVKRLHPQFARNERFVKMLTEEARLAARVRHINVVQVHDILEVASEVFVVMEYVRGLSLVDLVELQRRAGGLLPPAFVVTFLAGSLRGLHAAHEAVDWDGTPLHLVHRDFSPQNILVGIGGVPRVIDFGVAKALGRGDLTREDEFKGKLAYAAPEQLTGGVVTRQTDVFAAGIVLWELLAGARLFHGATDAETFGNVLRREVVSPIGGPEALGPETQHAREALAPVALRALARDPNERYTTAMEMASAMESAVAGAGASHIGHWVESLGAERLARERELARRIELAAAGTSAPTGAAPSPPVTWPAPAAAPFGGGRLWLLLAGVCLLGSAAGSAIAVLLLR
jgi:serine/threonine protein kinase